MLRSTLKERTIGRKLATQEEKGEATRMAKRMSKRKAKGRQKYSENIFFMVLECFLYIRENNSRFSDEKK